MKVVARRIKDNEWMVEQTNPYFPYEGHKNHMIVSQSDKEWLEKNNMDGKEVEGEVCKLPENDIFFQLTTPPIHSDPAGVIEVVQTGLYRDGGSKTYTDANGAKYIYPADTPFRNHEPGIYTNWPDKGGVKLNVILKVVKELNGIRNDWWKEDHYIPIQKPPTPQTGRTYTEGEVAGFAEWISKLQIQARISDGKWFYKGRYNTTKKLLEEFIKSKP